MNIRSQLDHSYLKHHNDGLNLIEEEEYRFKTLPQNSKALPSQSYDNPIEEVDSKDNTMD